jgi:hypothetical protein
VLHSCSRYDHTQPQLELETAVEAIEAVVERVHDVDIGPRTGAAEEGLVHPVHQQLKTFGWEVQTRKTPPSTPA